MWPPAPEPFFSARLGRRVALALAGEPLAPGELTTAEKAQWRALRTLARRHEWLLGRAALKGVLAPGTDTAPLRFPHPRLSVTHAGGTAAAAHVLGDVAGTGVDLEPWRDAPDPRAARYFLRASERAEAPSSESLLRLWTVKEALFKATADNGDAVLLDYELDDPEARWGEATGPGGRRMRYASTTIESGAVLSVAVCLVGGRRRAAV